ncbi:MAG: NAD-dependent epimerase/dehydratase family protein [Phycisphaerae bacterium]
MRILITGSSGLIGTNVGLALLDRGDTVLGIDRRDNPWTDRIETVKHDLAAGGLDGRPGDERFDLVLHLAANAKVYELVEHPDRAMDNITIAFNALDYCRTHGTPIVFASSREVYGDIHRHVTDEAAADFVVAESPYSASKIAAEAMIYAYGQCYDLPYLVFRFSNVYGRYDTDAERLERVIPLFIDRIARDEPIVVYGKDKVLDFTYVDDCVAGVLAGIDALAARRVVGQTINLAQGHGNTLVDVVNIAALALGKRPSVRYEPARRGEVTRYVADISKARTLLGYEPNVPLSSGLVKAVAWAQEAAGR